MFDTVPISLGGVSYVLVPSLRAYQAIEQHSEMSLRAVTIAYMQYGLPLGLLARVVLCGLQNDQNAAHDPGSFQAERIEGLLFREGPESDKMRQAITDFLEAMLYTPDGLKKKRAAQEAEQMAQSQELTAINRLLNDISGLQQPSLGGPPATSGVPRSKNSGSRSRPKTSAKKK